MDSILVTGGAGYVGSHVCKALASAGFQPVVIDNLVHGHRRAIKWGPFEEANIGDVDEVVNIFSRHRPIAVVHLAGFAYVGESSAEPLKYYDNNVAGTMGLLEAMRQTGVDKIIFSSTCATYGLPEGDCITETQEQKPINPYGRSKLMIEQMLRDCEPAYGISSIALRYFNAAGADPDGDLGECHDPETHLIPLVLDVALGRRAMITIFGTDYDTPDGTCVRDYVHVTDLADAHVAALDRLLRDPRSDAYNLGIGRGYSVREIIDAARRLTARDVAVTEGHRRTGDPPRLVADNHRALHELGWSPRYSDIEQIIEHAWQWHLKNFGNKPV